MRGKKVELGKQLVSPPSSVAAVLLLVDEFSLFFLPIAPRLQAS